MRRATLPPYTASPRGDGVHGADDLLAVGAFDEVAAGAGAQGGEDVLVVLVHGQRDDRQLRPAPAAARGGHAVEARHGRGR